MILLPPLPRHLLLSPSRSPLIWCSRRPTLQSSFVRISEINNMASSSSSLSRTFPPSSSSSGDNEKKKMMMRIAVLYQEIEPPVINGLKKPKKPGGYKDSSADIAYCLSRLGGSSSSSSTAIEVITPSGQHQQQQQPDPKDDSAWSFPDTEEGILSALEKGASHLWANTILFADHPLQTSDKIAGGGGGVKIIGQPPCLVEMYDDKEFVNEMLRKGSSPSKTAATTKGREEEGGSAFEFSMPRSWSVVDDGREGGDPLRGLLEDGLEFPIVAKPIRGRGSHGVKRCDTFRELEEHCRGLLKESPRIMLEEFLGGEEGTVTVMPPSISTDREGQEAKGNNNRYRALPLVRRFNHRDGIAPYNGVVAVTANSEAVIPGGKDDDDPAYARVAEECERAAEMLGVTAPIRIDVRRRRPDGGNFVLFDVNMKPNMTGPGRPGRDDQACLSLMAAEALGWDYGRLLEEIVKTAAPLEEVRMRRPKE